MESIESSALKSKIQQLQRQNAHGQTYIPDQLLSRLMTYKVVYAELKRVQVINPIYLEELAHMIREDATKVFAILVLVEEVGIVKDLLEKHKVFDFSLPLKLDILEDFGTVTTLNFLQTQKMFLAPQFTRSLLSVAIDSETVLPFFNDEKIGKEEFGIVYEISLDGDHQDLQNGFSGKVSSIRSRILLCLPMAAR